MDAGKEWERQKDTEGIGTTWRDSVILARRSGQSRGGFKYVEIDHSIIEAFSLNYRSLLNVLPQSFAPRRESCHIVSLPLQSISTLEIKATCIEGHLLIAETLFICRSIEHPQ